MSENEPEWIAVREAAAISGYSTEYIRLLVREGRVDARKKFTTWLVSRSSLLAYKERQEKERNSEG